VGDEPCHQATVTSGEASNRGEVSLEMSNADFGSFTMFLFLLLAAARLLGYLFARLRQPKVVGEILAGVLLGPSLLGRFAPSVSAAILPLHQGAAINAPYGTVLSFLYNFGLLLLMFASGAETKGLFNREDHRQVAWLGVFGTGIPFIAALCVVSFIPLGLLAGPSAGRLPLMLVISIAVAVTSIPVISKILYDLKILHTRFARLVLGVAVIEDIVLWAVLAVATALAQSGNVPNQTIAVHVGVTLIYFGLGLFLAPKLIARLTRSRWNVLAATSPIAYVVVVLLAYSALASLLDISLVFAAFLAGYAIVADRDFLAQAVASVSEFSFAVFIPIYFAVVGYKLDLSRTFSLSMLIVFLVLSSAVKFASAGLGARLAGFGLRDSTNLAAALNARGGPGIVLASVAFDAGIINAVFYTTLVLVAILTSQAAGTWLAYVLHTGRPLLSGESTRTSRRYGETPAVT
jgi:Kef-type K+ transport system membrane component KefB